MLQSMGSQRVGCERVTEQQQHADYKPRLVSENLKQLSKLSHYTLYGLLESVK